jgi:cardiolipin synthase
LFALITFGLASLTDALDGIIARARCQQSRLGFFLDPIADKLLINTSFISLAILKILPPWIVIIVITRDILIISGVVVIYKIDETRIISPTVMSKLTTIAQMLTVIIALLNYYMGGLSYILLCFVWISACMTVISGFNYIYISARIFNDRT